MLAFILPTIFHLKIFGDELSVVAKIRNVVLLLFGSVGGILGTISTINQLVRSFEGHEG